MSQTTWPARARTLRFQAPTWWQSKAFKRFRRNPLALVGAAVVLSFVLLAIFAPAFTTPGPSCARDLGLGTERLAEFSNPLRPVFWRAVVAPPRACYDIPRFGFSPIPRAPTAEHPFGITSGGYDIYYGVIWGTRTAFFVGILVVGAATIIGGIIGSLSGYFGGRLDTLFMRFTDTIFAFPSLVLALTLVAVLGRSLFNVMIGIAAVSWPIYARLLRGDVLQVKQQDYVESARALGSSSPRIIFRHVLPNAIVPLIIVASLDLGSVVVLAAALSFLGLGAPIGYADWGQMLSFARNYLKGPPGDPLAYWFVSFFPGLAIFLFVLGWNLLGDAVRDALDPRSS